MRCGCVQTGAVPVTLRQCLHDAAGRGSRTVVKILPVRAPDAPKPHPWSHPGRCRVPGRASRSLPTALPPLRAARSGRHNGNSHSWNPSCSFGGDYTRTTRPYLGKEPKDVVLREDRCLGPGPRGSLAGCAGAVAIPWGCGRSTPVAPARAARGPAADGPRGRDVLAVPCSLITSR